MGLYAYLWVLIGPYASLRVLMGPYRSVCVLMGLHRSLSVFIDSKRSLWVRMLFLLRLYWSYRSLCVIMHSNLFLWDTPGNYASLCFLVGLYMCLCIVMKFSGS